MTSHCILLVSTYLLNLLTPLQTLTHCGAHLTAPKGYISTPNFPLPYPVPIFCEWVIEAPFDHKVVIYFTQFYMKEGFTAADYEYYSSRIPSGVGRGDLGPVSSLVEPTYLLSNQRVLVLSLNVRSLDNVHLRVREHLLDVAGFNVTYEVMPMNGSIREDVCYHHCSFTGHCLASADYAVYGCQCFEGYFGEECQYDNDCGPGSASEVCQNGGTCRYYVGSTVRTCECLPGYTGAKCESYLSSNKTKISENCKDMSSTPKDYVIIYPWNKKCYDNEDRLIQRLEISEHLPVAEGVPLQITCIVSRGSQVTWLKDGYPIAFAASQGRIWHLTVPPDTAGRQAFLLGLDWTHELDSGEFTCEATDDSGRQERISAPLAVASEPELLMDPLSATVQWGSALTVTCVGGSSMRTTSYGWTKRGEPLADPERVEDLFPYGSRLLLPSARHSANYTCLLRSPTRVTRKTSVITVLYATDFFTSVCQSERYNGVRWKLTAIGAADVHNCPHGYTGYITRRCLRGSDGEGVWEKPDFSSCLSHSILRIKKEFDSRKIGYRRMSGQTLLHDLLEALSQRQGSMHRSEGDQVVDMLFNADADFHSEAALRDNWKKFLEITSLLFDADVVYKQQELIKLIFLVRKISLAFIRTVNIMDFNEQFESRCLRVNVITTSTESLLNAHIPWCQRNATQCTSMSLEINASANHAARNSSVIISTIAYRCLHLDNLANSPRRDESQEDLTPIFSLDLASTTFEQAIKNVQNTVTYPVTRNVSSDDQIDCLKFILQEGTLERFKCVLIKENLSNAHCHCNGTGLFTFDVNTNPGYGEYGHYHLSGKLLTTILGCVIIILTVFTISLKGAFQLKRINLYT